MESEIIRVFIVDDSATFRRLIRSTVESSPFIEVVGVAASAEEAVRTIGEARPHVVIVDLAMPGLGGLPLLRTLKHDLNIAAICVSSNSDPDAILQARTTGNCEFISKPKSPGEHSEFRLRLVNAVKEARSNLRCP